MSHEDFLQPDELEKERERFKPSPPRETLAQPRVVARNEGYIMIDIPPIVLPTLPVVCKWLITSPAVRVLLYLLIGAAVGFVLPCVFVTQSQDEPPPVVIPATETLEGFVARESQALSAEERHKLIVVTETVLRQHFDTPSAIREEFRFQRLKAGLDSPAFQAFMANWSAKVTEQKIEESVESVRGVYMKMLHGLQSVKAYIDFSGEPVEGFVEVSLSNVTSLSAVEDVPVSPGVLPTEDKPQKEQRQRFFRRR